MPNILYLDDFIVVAVKPAGVVSESNGENSLPSLLEKKLREQSSKKITLYTVHRLDRDTEGIIVYALSSSAAASLSRDIADGVWKKTYTALLCGKPEKDSDTLRDMLYYDRAKSKSFVVQRERKGVKQAILDYSVISTAEDEKITAVKIELQTGRTHQIRVQFASRGLPLCGDRHYGAPASSGNRLALCATELKLKHPKSKEPLEFKITPTNFSI